MASIAAPIHMTRRESVADLVATLRDDAPIPVLRIRFSASVQQFPTTSFIDELVRQVLSERLADVLQLEAADRFTSKLAQTAADRYGVIDRLQIVGDSQSRSD